MQKTAGFLNAFQLKVLMAALMVLDHLYYNLFPESLLWAHYAARVVAPVFTYLMAEGMFYTRDRWRYIARMLGFGVAMLAGSIALHSFFGQFTWSLENLLTEFSTFTILISLGLSAAVIAAREKSREGGKLWWLWAAAPVGLLLVVFQFEGGYIIPLMAIIFYYLRARPLLMCAVYAAAFAVIYALPWLQGGELPSQFFMIFAVIPILSYNGERGPTGPFARYFFYVFYPLHVWIIYLAERMAGIR